MFSMATRDGTDYQVDEDTLKRLREQYPSKNVDEVLTVMEAKLRDGEYLYRFYQIPTKLREWIERSRDLEDKKQKPKYVPAEESKHYAYRYEREHPMEEPNPAPPEYAEAFLKTLREIIPEFSPKPKAKGRNQIGCEHRWRVSFYGGGDWCWQCGAFKDQFMWVPPWEINEDTTTK